MKNKVKEYPEQYATTVAVMKTTRDFHCDENYRFLPSGFFEKTTHHILNFLAVLVFTVHFHLHDHVRIEGRENYKKMKKQGAVVIHNHCHLFDTVMISSLITRFDDMTLVTLEENFQIPVAGRIIRYLGCVPIPKSYRANKKFMKLIDELLQDDKKVSIVPEGYMWPYYPGLRPFYPGAFRFAVKNQKPALPVVIVFRKKKEGSDTVYPILKILEPIYPSEDLPLKEAEEDLGIRVYDAMKKELENFYPEGMKYRDFVDERIVR